MGWYRTGTITLVAGSDVVLGAGTAWVRNALPGDILSVPGAVLEVKRIVSDGELQLATAYAGAGGVGLSYALVPTQGYVPEALAAMQQILNEFGDIWQAWQAGDLQGRGLVLKGSVDAVEDLPAEGNAAGDGYMVAASQLYVWNGTEWKYAGEMITSAELIALRQDAVTARNQAQGFAGQAGDSKLAVDAAKAAVELSSGAALAAGRIKATVAEARAAYPATTLPDSISWVLPNATDGFTALTAIRNTGSGAGQWAKVMALANDDDVAKLLNAAAPSPLTAIGGTANAITGTSGTIRQPLPGCSVRFTPLYANTGATTLTLTLAGGGASAAYGFIDDNGGPLGAGALQPGYAYEALFTGSVWRIIRYGDDHERVKRTPQKLTGLSLTTGATSDYAGTTAFPLTLADGVEVTLIPPSDNTASPRLSVAGTGGPFFNIRYQNGGPVPVGGLRADRYYRLAWQSTGSIWKIVVNGYDTERIDGLLKTAPSMLTSVGGTPNAITATSSTITQVVVNTRVLFFPIADNTGAASLAVSFPDGTSSAAYNLVDAAGGAIAPKTLRPGRPYEAVFNGAVWRIFGYGDDHERVKTGHQRLTNVGGTPNAITASVDFPLTLGKNTRVTLVPVADNTGPATLKIDDGGAYGIAHGYGSLAQAGVLKAGRYYELTWQEAGSVWKITRYGTAREDLLNISVGKVTAVGGTANSIEVTTEMGDAPAPGTTVSFVALFDNDSTDVKLNTNGTGAFLLLTAGDAPLALGDIKAGAVIQAKFDGVTKNVYRLMSNGQSARAVVADAINGLDPAYALRAKLMASPYGDVAYVDGARVITPRNLVGTGLGSSVGNAAGAADPAVSTPLIVLMNALAAELGSYGNLNFITDNQSVGGQVISQYVTQLAASPYAKQDVVLSIFGMNDVAVASYNTGQTFFGFEAGLESCCYKVRYGRGAIHFLATTAHMHPTRRPPVEIPVGAALGYPVRTFNAPAPFEFNAATQTIKSDTFAIPEYGGGALKVGSSLQAMTGANAGLHTVTAISSDRQTITVDGTIIATVTEAIYIKHVNLSVEDHLVPPASASYVSRDWTGNGIALVGDLRAWHINKRIRAAARKYGAILIDVEPAFFRGVELHGWDAMYDSPNYNHPSTLGYELGYSVPLRAAAKQLAEQLRA